MPSRRQPRTSNPVRGASKGAGITPSGPRDDVTTGFSDGEVPYDVELVSREGVFASWKGITDREFYDTARYWSYVVSSRARFAGRALESFERRALESPLMFQLSPEAIRHLATADRVEVRIPFEREEVGWAARIFPWEAVLNMVTCGRSSAPGCLVVRHLCRPRRSPSAGLRRPDSLLLVLSSPGPVGDLFSFDGEPRWVAKTLGLADRLPPITHPTVEALRRRVARERPDVIHVAALDVHQAASVFPDLAPALANGSGDPRLLDGLVLAGPAGGVCAVDSESAGTGLCAGQPGPVLVTFHAQYSGARLAPMTVAAGAVHAVGFQGQVDDAFSRRWLTAFYQRWRGSGWDVLEAFGAGQESVRSLPVSRTCGGAVLWSDRSLLHQSDGRSGRPRRRPAAIAPRAAASRHPRDVIVVECQPEPRLNYALLHNGRSIFRALRVVKLCEGRHPDVRIQVRLDAGIPGTPVSLVTALPWTSGVVELRDQIPLPPAAPCLPGQAQEARRGSLHVSVTCRGATIHEHTYRVTLQPPDEWRDDDVDRAWLPSFVLPRDPAVVRILDHAQRYLCALRDCPRAGFDGYGPGDDGDPAAKERVRDQVRAIWTALVLDFPLGYIGPSSESGATSQRVRSPSRVLAERRGTCLDLALLVAACLEAIGLDPVVCLMRGHALAGYWRTRDARERWGPAGGGRMDLSAAEPWPVDMDYSPAPHAFSWMISGREGCAELARPMAEGALVPLEATGLTRGMSLGGAEMEGMKWMGDASRFEAMLDIQSARAHPDPVTPLPLEAMAGA